MKVIRKLPKTVSDRYQICCSTEDKIKPKADSLRAICKAKLIAFEFEKKGGPIKIVTEKGNVCYGDHGAKSMDIRWHILLPPNLLSTAFEIPYELKKEIFMEIREYLCKKICCTMKFAVAKLIREDNLELDKTIIQKCIEDNSADIITFECNYVFLNSKTFKFIYRSILFQRVLQNNYQSKYCQAVAPKFFSTENVGSQIEWLQLILL